MKCTLGSIPSMAAISELDSPAVFNLFAMYPMRYDVSIDLGAEKVIAAEKLSRFHICL
ncbi:hypothetical protein NKDENANG_00766 [Candidatus Entotheonellaceae bacterium PAL068K]